MQSAEACSCAEEIPEVRPNADDLVVPTNTKIWVKYHRQWCTTPELRDDNDLGHEIGVNNVGNMLVVTPTEELEVGTTYTFSCGDESNVPNTLFTVTEQVDVTPPSTSQCTATGHTQSESMCGDSDYLGFDLVESGVITGLDVHFAVDNSGWVHDSGWVDLSFTDDTPYRVGQEPCRDPRWDWEEDGEIRNVRFGSYDLAGNFGGWSQPCGISNETPDDDVPEDGGGPVTISSCACSTPGRSDGSGSHDGQPLGLAMAILGAAAAFARKSRRHKLSRD